MKKFRTPLSVDKKQVLPKARADLCIYLLLYSMVEHILIISWVYYLPSTIPFESLICTYLLYIYVIKIIDMEMRVPRHPSSVARLTFLPGLKALIYSSIKSSFQTLDNRYNIKRFATPLIYLTILFGSILKVKCKVFLSRLRL